VLGRRCESVLLCEEGSEFGVSGQQQQERSASAPSEERKSSLVESSFNIGSA
jgi:hypothetical protein